MTALTHASPQLTSAAPDFFDELSENNNNAWWEANSDRYEHAVRAPLVELLARLEPEFGVGRILRPQHDRRFSPAGAPYKTYAGAFVSSCDDIGYYLLVDARGVRAAAGCRRGMGTRLLAYRAAVLDEKTGVELDLIVADVTKAGCALTGQRLVGPPRGGRARPSASGAAALPILGGRAPLRRPSLAWHGVPGRDARVSGMAHDEPACRVAGSRANERGRAELGRTGRRASRSRRAR